MTNPGKEVVFTPLEVKVYDNHFEDAFKKFKSLVQKEGIIVEYKQRQTYEKPSVKKRRKQREAIQRCKLAKLREEQILSGEWDKIQERKEQKRLKKVEDRKNKNTTNSHD